MALARMVLTHRDEIRAAMNADFGAHPELFTDLAEVLAITGRAAAAIEQLGSWLAEDERPADPALYGTAQAGIRYQPKGVVGNIVPGNFPFDLALGPLVEMLAAGNRVIIKPSEYTPAGAALLRRMVTDRHRDRVTRRLPLVLVVDPPKHLRIMQEEIFGPILPVIPCDDLDGALAGINDVSARSASTYSARTAGRPRRCCGRTLPAAQVSTSARYRARCRHWASAASGEERGVPRVLQSARRGAPRYRRPG